MKDKSYIILGVVVFTLFSLNIANTYGRYTKTVTKTGTIATAEVGYCKSKNITSFKECLIRNDSQQELNDALNTISLRSNSVNFANVEPIGVYIPKTTYTNIENKTNMASIASVNNNSRFTYVIENKLITEFDVDDADITKINFNTSTGYYTYTDYQVGNVNDLVTTAEDMENGIYKYTCLNSVSKGNCTSLFLFTEKPYFIYDYYRFKQGYKYTYQVVGTSSSNPGLYKGEDDYTIYEDNIAKDNFTYYYRGNVQNNWVSFGNFLWRIIRINGDGSIRMIYSGLKGETNHTGSNAQIGTTSFGDTSFKTATTKDVTGLTNDIITMTYSTGRYGTTYVGYMYNPAKEIATYPNIIVGSSNTNTGGWKLNYFPIFNNINNTINYYFFKNFDPSTDCFTGSDDDSGACTLKCKSLGNDGDNGIDCVQSNWNTLATTSDNYSATDPGVYSNQYVYKSDYKYTCWSYGTPVLHSNSDGTSSIYVTCPIVSEIVGTIKDQPTQAKVKYHGLFSKDATTSNKNVKDSNIKTQVDKWYASNIYGKYDSNSSNLLESYLSDEIFCNDRTSNSIPFPIVAGNSSYLYGPYTRNVANKNPSFKCSNLNNDGFTLKTNEAESIVKAAEAGNNMLTYPVGLITADEVTYSGGDRNFMNLNYYLYIGTSYWTMSPYTFISSYVVASLFSISNTGALENNIINYNHGIRPVINLKSDVLYASGIGTESDPYIITIK